MAVNLFLKPALYGLWLNWLFSSVEILQCRPSLTQWLVLVLVTVTQSPDWPWDLPVQAASCRRSSGWRLLHVCWLSPRYTVARWRFLNCQNKFRHRWIFYKKAELLPWTAPIFANKILGKILTKTAILMQNCIEDDMVRRNWQNILGFRWKF